jgi:hypothetical protein
MTNSDRTTPSGVKKPTTKEKIAKLESKISELELLLPDATLRRGGIIERQLRELKESLRKQMTHEISKIDTIRRYTVSGSYGAGKRTK